METSAKVPGLVLVASVAASLSVSCSGRFRACEETRTCRPDSTRGADAGPDASSAGVPPGGAGGTQGTAGGAPGIEETAGGASNSLGGASVTGGQPSTGGASSAGGALTTEDEDAGPRDGGVDCAADACACGSSSCVSSCEECDANAECEPGTSPVCSCKQGFDGDGLTCMRNVCESLAGEPPVCGPNQACSVSAGAARCACATGYADCTSASGCETDLRTTPEHCGECGFSCAGNLGCSGGACEQVVASLVLSGGNTCAMMIPGAGASGSELKCWGDHVFGILRTSLSEPQTEPLSVSGIGLVRDVSIGLGHGCALPASSDAVLCWGDNEFFQLASTQENPVNSVVTTRILGGVSEVAASALTTCVRLPSGVVQCWGSDFSFALGQRDPADRTSSPSAVPGVSDARVLEAGAYGFCVLRTNDTAACWGFGALESPTTIVRASGGSPLSGIKSAAVGGGHYCFLLKDKSVVCGGSNDVGQLGIDTISEPAAFEARVRAVPTLSNIKKIAAGLSHTCAVTESGDLYCWGNDSLGQLGADPAKQAQLSGTTRYSPKPLRVANLAPLADVYSGGGLHTCVRLESGQVQCFGDNGTGQLGNQSTSTSWRPVPVVNLP